MLNKVHCVKAPEKNPPKCLGPLMLNEDSVGRSSADLKVAVIYSNVQRSTLVVGSTEIQVLKYFQIIPTIFSHHDCNLSLGRAYVTRNNFPMVFVMVL